MVDLRYDTSTSWTFCGTAPGQYHLSKKRSSEWYGGQNTDNDYERCRYTSDRRFLPRNRTGNSKSTWKWPEIDGLIATLEQVSQGHDSSMGGHHPHDRRIYDIYKTKLEHSLKKYE